MTLEKVVEGSPKKTLREKTEGAAEAIIFDSQLDEFEGGCLISIVIALLAVLIFLAVHNPSPHHGKHYKQHVYKLKNGRYEFQDKKGQWWIYLQVAGEVVEALPDSAYPQPWQTDSGSVRLPLGGVWSKGVGVPPEEVEGEMEASVEETTAGPEADAPDSGSDSDSSSDGGDAGGDGGDSGGGDSGDSGGGDGGGGGD